MRNLIYPGGVTVRFLPVNSCYVVTWCNQVHRLFPTKREAVEEAERITKGVK